MMSTIGYNFSLYILIHEMWHYVGCWTSIFRSRLYDGSISLYCTANIIKYEGNEKDRDSRREEWRMAGCLVILYWMLFMLIINLYVKAIMNNWVKHEYKYFMLLFALSLLELRNKILFLLFLMLLGYTPP